MAKRRGKGKGRHLSKIEKKEVKQLIRADIEDKDRSLTVVSGTAMQGRITPIFGAVGTGWIDLINMQRGTQDGTRIGNEIMIKKWRVNLTLQSGAVGVIQAARVVIFIDKAPNGILPLAAEVFYGTATAGCSPNYTYNFNNVPSRFRILYDKTFRLEPKYAATITTRSIRFHKKFKKPVKVQFNDANSGDYSDILKNNLHVMLITDVAVNYPIAYFMSQMIYEDA